MEKFVTKQAELYKRIKLTVENMNKKGAAQITKGVITARLELLEKNWNVFYETHNQILDVFYQSNTDHFYFKQDYMGLCEEAYTEQKAALLDLQDDVAADNQPVPQVTSKPRFLSKIELPVFSGDYKNWTNFRDLFESLVIKDESLSPVEKLHYLKTSVEGEPAKLLQNISVSADNFKRAWAKITKRYQNIRVLIHSQLTALHSLPHMKRESAQELKELVSGTTDAVQALEALNRPVEKWDDWLVFITAEKLDPKTRMDWEKSIGNTSEPPTIEELMEFLASRLRALEAVEGSTRTAPPTKGSTPTWKQEKRSQENNGHRFKTHATHTSGQGNRNCAICKKEHFLLFCPTYKSMDPRDRKQLVTQKRLCYNCLAPHSSSACKSSKRCQICVGKHHTSLHLSFEQTSADRSFVSSQVPETSEKAEDNSKSEQSVSTSSKAIHCAMTSCSGTYPESIILATAELELQSDRGDRVRVRALIDPCSEVSLLEESVAQLLKLKRVRQNIPVIGVGKMQTYTKGRVSVSMISRVDKTVSHQLTAYILPRLSAYQAAKSHCPSALAHLEGLELADPHFLSSRRINLILGADIYAQIIKSGLRKGPPNAPIAQATTLGWILTGPLRSPQTSCCQTDRAISLQCSVRESELVDTLTRFWKLEEVPSMTHLLTEEENQCEQHYRQTHTRNETGRYVVCLPFKSAPKKLGESKGAAISFLQKLENRLKSDANLQDAYCEFLREYEMLGHMERISDSSDNELHYYLPHHGVRREASSTTKLRVVFNASYATTSGLSLNDLVHKGPNLLPDIFSLLLRWRTHAIVFSADIEKMYRQILIKKQDCDLQRIVWRDSPKAPISSFRLLTVTYGMACAPYLAIRTLRQLSEDEKDNYPLAALCLLTDVYVDDVVSGADTIEEASVLQQQLIKLLMAGGFKLRKWASNEPSLLTGFSPQELASSPNLNCNIDGVSSLLGLKWNTSSDSFLFTIQPRLDTGPVTKRIVFREIAGIFDPLGLLAPVVATAKIFMQSLWLSNLTWDDPLSITQQRYWLNYYEGLSALSPLRIPRWLLITRRNNFYELHGFADASEKAYAAVIYLRTTNNSTSEASSKLVAAKTRVAPLKQISLPRLELCAATLLVRLMVTVRKALNLPDCTINLWSDSSVVLGWLQRHPSKWKTFVANRVSEIQTSLSEATWRHIRSAENPADQASRGVMAEKLIESDLWWKGPSFLSQSTYNFDVHLLSNLGTEQEVRTTKTVLTTISGTSFLEELINKHATIRGLCTVTAWCLRFLKRNREELVSRETRHYVNARELLNARLTLIRCYQSIVFANEKSRLGKSASVTQGALARLNPFLDEREILRVGGRLKHSLLDYKEKHPIILPTRGHFTTLMIREAHLKTLHGGLQLTLGTIRQTYWILCGRRAVRTYIHSCLTCRRWRAKTAQQQMSDLPSTRVRPARPFSNSGVDYAGPLYTKLSPGRGHRTRKSYVAVFVCMATRAVHLELVSDCTTDAFLAAYRRFVSRRGICSTLHSDQGTTFVGANRELRELLKAVNFTSVAAKLEKDGTSWKFNPPAAPHFGGIWEAAVKSMKFHLRRVVGDTALTFEEASTVLAQIEACLNSRPLVPLSDDTNSFDFLTPGHFLIGAPLAALPEPSLTDERLPRLTRWQLCQQMRDHIWKRWSAEYLQHLQARNKWLQHQPNIKKDDLCLVTSEVTPPTKWPIGRVIETFPGSDGLVRVVLVRTPSGTLRRPIHKLCILPEVKSD